MTLAPEPQQIPLREVNGTLRVTGTRIPLETIVYCFQQGETPEMIVQQYPTLKLADVYTLIAYYLKNREAVEAYVKSQETRAEKVRKEIEAIWPSDGIRERLLARRAEMESAASATGN